MIGWTEDCFVLPLGIWDALLCFSDILVEYKSLGRWSDDDNHLIQEGNNVWGATRRIALSGEFACYSSMSSNSKRCWPQL
mmetsp:Transcript_10026/g.21460  ORF Transcript_10026/g.21460 Transcript_10026/m.21460 type:complete len:80 (+) Transcript_10026:384-623(+)